MAAGCGSGSVHTARHRHTLAVSGQRLRHVRAVRGFCTLSGARLFRVTHHTTPQNPTQEMGIKKLWDKIIDS